MDDRTRSAACVVFKDGKVLLGRHTYGAGKGLLIIPGGFLNMGEAPWDCAKRETLEETGVEVEIGAPVGIRFKDRDWYVIFKGEYIRTVTGEHDTENSEVLWVDISEALERDDVPSLTKEAIRSALKDPECRLSEKTVTTREEHTFFKYFG